MKVLLIGASGIVRVVDLGNPDGWKFEFLPCT
jgi:hypothetical protein